MSAPLLAGQYDVAMPITSNGQTDDEECWRGKWLGRMFRLQAISGRNKRPSRKTKSNQRAERQVFVSF